MHRLILILCSVFVFFIVSGCVQEEAVYSINPDGSGKVFYSYTIPLVDMAGMMGAGGVDMQMKRDPYADLKEAVMATLEDSEGVEAWSGVSYSLKEDQRIHFEGTAYFDDINNLSLVTGNLTEDNRLNIVYTVLAGGEGGVIEIENVEPDAADAGSGSDMPSMSDDQLKSAVSAAKMQYQQSRMMLKGMFSDLSSATVFNLPGGVEDRVNFEKVGSGEVRLEINGEKLLNVMDTIMEDEDFLSDVVRSGQEMQDISEAIEPAEFNRMMFGERGPIKVVFDFGKGSLFDYSSEMTDAREGYDMMLSRLLLKDGEGGAGWGVSVEAEAEERGGLVGYQRAEAGGEGLAGAGAARGGSKGEDVDYKSAAISNIRQGRKLEAEGDYVGAIKQYEIVTGDKDSPGNYVARSLFEIGKCYYLLGRDDKAREYFDMVLSEFPEEKMAAVRSRRKLRQIEERALEVESTSGD